MPLVRLRAAALAAGIAFLPGAALADQILIQLPSMPAPAVYADGSRVDTAVTIFARTDSVDAGAYLCRNMPLIRDALVTEFHRQAITALGRKTLDVAGTAPRLIHVINGALPEPVVRALSFMPGVPTPPLTPADLAEGKRESNRRENDPNACHRVTALREEIAPFVEAPAVAAVRRKAPPMPMPSQPHTTHPQMLADAPPPAVRAGSDDIPAPAGSLDAVCDLDLGQLWRPGFYLVGGASRALVRVFTVDRDNDGRTENVGFLFRGAGGHEILVHYFAPPGSEGARDVRGLRLADENAIRRLCFGQLNFDAAPVPLPVAPEPAAPPPPPKDSAPLWVAIGSAVVLLIMTGGLAGYLLARKRKAERRRKLDRRMERMERRKGGGNYTGPERRQGDRRARAERRDGADRRG